MGIDILGDPLFPAVTFNFVNCGDTRIAGDKPQTVILVV
jgi:hypothetical protein